MLAIYLTQVAPRCCGPRSRRKTSVFHQRFVWRRLDRDRLLGQAEEQLAAAARPPTVEPERELVEVVLQMFVSHRAVMCAEQPSLQERHDLMDVRHELRPA